MQFFSVSVSKMEDWKVIEPLNEANQVWCGSDDESDGSDENEGEGLSDSDGDEGENGSDDERKESDEETNACEGDALAVKKGEAMRDYFERTQAAWLSKAIAELEAEEPDSEQAPELVPSSEDASKAALAAEKKQKKHNRAKAFSLAHKAYSKAASE